MTHHPKTEVEHLLTDDQRRWTIEEHAAWRESIAPKQDFDEIDEAAADIPGPVQLRKEREVSRLMSILDELETGKDGRH